MWEPSWLGLLAEVYGQAGLPEEGLTLLDEALALVGRTGERYWEAEIHRLKGELLCVLPTSYHLAAEASLHQALAIARRQQAKSLELRAAVSLTRLWQQQGKRREARQLVGEVYDWFTEGFDTADLQEAKTLLESLA